jgi:uroporphyrinogen decarboxylase
MTDQQWSVLKSVVNGGDVAGLPCGFIIDCPWLPGWYGITIAEYLSSENLWFEANGKVLKSFPDCMFLPGFWSEFGMCTEPSAFGTRCIFPPDEFPFAEKIIHSIDEVSSLKRPNVEADGLLPFMLNRLKWAQPRIEDLGHRIRFSVSRGPLNVASFLMGTTEFLIALKTDPRQTHKLLRIVTDFLKDWHQLQRESFDAIDGIMMLDDIVGFISEEDFLEFGLPYMEELYAPDVTVKFFHNDAPCAASIGHYAGIGINFFNPGIQNSITELRELSDHRLTILGNIPPRDVLAAGTPHDVSEAVTKLIEVTEDDPSRLILSCAGGMPPDVSSENLEAFLTAAGRA